MAATKEPMAVESLYDVPNTTTKDKDGWVAHGIHHVKEKNGGEYFVTYLSNGQRLRVKTSGEFTHVPLSFVEEAWGNASYYSTKFGIEFKHSVAPADASEIRNALISIIKAWHGQSWELVEVMPAINVVIYRHWYSIGD